MLDGREVGEQLMATYLQLQAEPAWGAEHAPPNLEALYVGIRAFLGRGADAVGGKGDANHLRGYHRSRAWILNSRFSAYRGNDYSVQLALDKGGDPNWLSAMDATPYKVETLIAMCKRLDAAMRADTLPQVREWYGNVNGDKVVDGWDDVAHRAASSDSSHLWHLHISFYRSRANDDHSNLLRVLTGRGGDTDMKFFSITDHGPRFQAAGRYDDGWLGMYEFASSGAQFEAWRGGAEVRGITHAQFDAGAVGKLDAAAVRKALASGGSSGQTPVGGLVPHTHTVPAGETGPAVAEQ